MSERMNVLIGYDGSSYADAAIDDLRGAGLPNQTEALVVSVGEEAAVPPLLITKALEAERAISIVNHADTHEAESLANARDLAYAGIRQLESYFPNWNVQALAVGGRPATELIQQAREWLADLLVVGCQGRSAVGRFIFGSVSLECATDSPCSVRIGRAFKNDAHGPQRIVVGLDGFAGSERVLKYVLKREWPKGTELRIIAVDDGQSPVRKNPGGMMELAWAQGFKVYAQVAEGDPATVLMTAADEWKAHCIFVDTEGFGGKSDDSTNTVATELAKNANCSVEIVR